MLKPSNQRITLPSHQLNPVFGKVSYQPVDEEIEVMFTILMATVGEGWQTGVALDASDSMRAVYGKSFLGNPPQQAIQRYKEKGLLKIIEKDGLTRNVFSKAAFNESLQKGYIKPTTNVVQQEARSFIQYLAQNLDADGGTTVIYWACGETGEQIEWLGDIRAEDCATLSIKGPKQVKFGQGTHLLPALKYFDERFNDAPNGMYIFVTDGHFDDFSAVKDYCIDLAKRIEKGTRNPFKGVLIGVGHHIDEAQMIALDDLETGTDIDIWDHKIAADMREVTEIFAELVDESMIIAPQGSLYDDNNQRVARFSDGLPARVTFRMPKTAQYFELEVAGQDRIRQSILL